MFRIAVLPSPEALPATVRCLRGHTDLSVAEIRARLADGRPVVEFPFHDIPSDIERCRSLLADLQIIGAGVRVFEHVEGFDEQEETLEYLNNVMQRNVDIAADIRAQMDREAVEGDEE